MGSNGGCHEVMTGLDGSRFEVHGDGRIVNDDSGT